MDWLKSHWYIPVAVVAGIIITIVFLNKATQYMDTHQVMTQVLVPARTIPPYTLIKPEDITYKSIVQGGQDTSAIQDTALLKNKITIDTLYAGEQIRPERIVDAQDVADKQNISLLVDLARCVGGDLKPGDLVDIWWIDSLDQKMWTPVAYNSIVVQLKDSAGRNQNSKNTKTEGIEATPSTTPSIVVLSVDAQDIPSLIGGAHPNSNNIVLVKKFNVSLPEEPVITDVDEGKENKAYGNKKQ